MTGEQATGRGGASTTAPGPPSAPGATSAGAVDVRTEPVPFDVTGELPPDRATTLLEASAGTGKTWTIAALVARMVAEGTCTLERMLVVTFGRAASQELRERVRARLVLLERALAAAVRDEPLPHERDDVEMFLVDGVEPGERARRWARVREALVSFDSATIATTHQFCQMVLKSLGVAGDTDTGATLVEDLDELVQEVVDDFYVRGFAGSEQPPPFTRKDALAIARRAVEDPVAHLEPRDAGPTGAAGVRLRFATGVRKELDVRKRRLGLLSYDDLLTQLARALEGADSPAAARMRQRWSVVLVDEFQDTDPVQWQVLDRAFTGQARMILIGDPKQAIYAFRGGDIDTYQLARDAADHHATLVRNYRSDAGLLTRLGVFLDGAELGSDITVRGVQAEHEGSRLQGAHASAPFRLRLVDRARFPSGRSKNGPSIADLRRHVAHDLACDVRALLTSGATLGDRPLRAADVAVLCQSHAQGTIVRRALAEVGVPAVSAAGGSVFTSDGARQWLTLLEAIERPQVSGRVRAAGLTAFFGETARTLVEGDEVATDRIAERLRGWGMLLRSRGVAAVLEATEATLVPGVLGTVGGERLLTDLRHAAQVLHEQASAEGLGVVALVGWLREKMAQDARVTATERTRRLDSDASAVQVLTVHGSKGLEFGVVYAPFLADRHLADPDFLRFHDEHGRRCLDVGGAPFAAEHRERAATEDRAEDLRLLYVAMTRAKSQLVTWWLPSTFNTPASPLHRLLMGRAPGLAEVPASLPVPDDATLRTRADRWEAAGAFSVETADPERDSAAPSGSPPAPLEVRRWSRWIDHVWRRTSYTSLSKAAEAEIASLTETDGAMVVSEPEVVPREDEPTIEVPPTASGAEGDVVSPMADLPVGATFGSLVHLVLEHADPAAPEHGGDLRAELRARVDDALVQWPVPLDAEVLTDALVAVCDSPLGPLAGSTLREIGLRDRLRELDFEIPLHGGDAGPRRAERDGDAGARPGVDPTLADLAPVLRRHLPPGDPLLPYADVVDGPAYAAQRLRGYLTGSVDVVLRVGERYLVVDYKTNWLGPLDEPLTAHAYAPAALAAAMTHSSYPLQALLYAVVLHRFLRWRLRGYDPATHLGGVLYLYVRGMCGPRTPVVDGQPCGVFSWSPPAALVTEISDLLDGVVRR